MRNGQAKLCDIDWAGFDHAFAPAFRHANMALEMLDAGASLPDPDGLPPDTLSQITLRLRQRALTGQPLPDAATDWAERVAAAAARAGRNIDTPAEARVTALQLAADALMAEALAASGAGRPAEALDLLDRASQRLEAAEAPVSPRKQADLDDYAVLIEDVRSRICAAAGDHEAAERMAWAGVTLRDRVAPARPAAAEALFFDLMSYVERFGARNPDRALTRLIPLLRHRLPRLLPWERLVLLMTLADLYRAIGDLAAAHRIVADETATLGATGLPLPDIASPQRLLEAVTAAAGRADPATSPTAGRADAATSPTAETRCARFAALWKALMYRANVLRQTEGAAPATHAAALAWMLDLGAAATGRMAALSQEPDAEMARLATAAAGRGIDLPPPAAAPPAPEAPDRAALARFEALSDAADRDGPSEALALAFGTLAGDLDPALAAQAETTAAGMLATLDRPEAAVPRYESACALARTADDLWQETQAVLGLAILPDTVRPTATKRAELGRLIDRIEARRARLNAAYLPSSFMADKVMPYAVAAHLAGKAGDHADRLRLLERLRACDIHGPPLSGPATDGLRQEVMALSAALRAAPDAATAARLRTERRLAWDELMIARPHERPDFDLGRLQARLGRAVALSAFHLSPEVLDITLVTAGQVIAVRRILSDWPDLPATLAAVLNPDRLDLRLGARLDALAEVLLPAEIRPALRDASEIVVAPHQHLHGLPWGALPLDGVPLILGRPVACVPNLTVLTTRQRIAPPGPPGFFGVATRRTEATDSAGRRFIDLPDAAREVAAAATHFARSGSLVDDAATRAAFLGDPRLTAASTLLIALHGTDVADPSLARAPMEATLALRDGSVDGIDLACLPLSAGLVITTACFSGRRAARLEGMDTLPDDSLYGLQAAFLLAGAGAVLAALWKAGDATARRISGLLCAALGAGCPPAVALHRAIRAHLDTPGLRRIEREPYAWAPYMLTAFSPAAFAFGTDQGDQR